MEEHRKERLPQQGPQDIIEKLYHGGQPVIYQNHKYLHLEGGGDKPRPFVIWPRP